MITAESQRLQLSNDTLINSLTQILNIPSNYNFTILSCDFNVACKLSPEVYILTIGKTVFVEDALVSTDIISVYNPRRVRLFIWEND